MPEVAGLKPVLPALIAVTEHVAAVVALNKLPFTAQPEPLTWKVTSPVPEPPVVVSAIGVPVKPVRIEFDIANAAWSARAYTNVLAADVVELNPLLAALDAITTQFVTVAATSVVPIMEQSAPLTVKVRSPVPEPPVVVRGNEVPGRFVRTLAAVRDAKQQTA